MKRVLSCWLILMMLFTSTALGTENTGAISQEIEVTIEEKTIVEPRYTYIAYMTIGLNIDANGNLGYSGSACAANHNLRITLTLQRSTNGIFWDELESIVKTGYYDVASGSTRTVPEGDYFYRAKIVAEVLDSNRNVIETATGYSDAERY